MDEDSSAKAAPVTRLRRRLSTEAEVQSPLTPSTPNKKRTRLAKPTLEQIEENGKSTPTGGVSKRVTRRTSTKDAEGDEAPMTPSRRSTRIRSNTSLVLDAVQNTVADSPRAKRALRRASQLGSDNESSTPGRPTRRTRKDSTSSVEKLAVTNTNEKTGAQVADVISEEPEKEILDSKLNTSAKLTPTRKSPRLRNKGTTVNDSKHDLNESSKEEDTKNKSLKVSSDEVVTSTDENNPKPHNISSAANLSRDSAKLIDTIDEHPKINDIRNKTISIIDVQKKDKGNRQRTKSWTTVTCDTANENIDCNKLGSGDGITNKNEIQTPNKNVTQFNVSIENKENMGIVKQVDENYSVNTETMKMLGKSPGKNVKPVILMEDSDSNSSSLKLSIDVKPDSGDQCVPVVKDSSPKRLPSESFAVEPMDIDESMPENVTINDFSDQSNSSEDKNAETKDNLSMTNQKSGDNDKSLNKSKTSSITQKERDNSKRKSSLSAAEEIDSKSNNQSLHDKSHRKSSLSYQSENSIESDNNKSNRRKSSLSNPSEKSIESDSNKSKRKSSLSMPTPVNNDKRKSSVSLADDKINQSINKSKKKSMTETEITSNENKSTLVLSQLKDVSTNETSNAVKSPNDTNNDLLKSSNDTGKSTDKKDTSINYLTSTPLQQKSLKKLAMPLNTSVFTPDSERKNNSKNKSNTNSPAYKTSYVENDSDSSEESEDESRERRSNLIDDEAEEASDDYESGDSRNDEEKQYEKDHEIIEKGETLESEEFSDDSNYEKDSFVVTSDEEDNDLLSGSGDDLSMSDNELKMTAKSKKKYDERMRKEQKRASREMFEARHKLNKSKESKSKSQAKKMESSDSESENENRPKKNNRLRIDSSIDMSADNKDADESIVVKKKKSKKLSESMCEGNADETEITINNKSISETKDPLKLEIKQEVKTPQKDFNMSIAVINENIEQVQVESNASILKPNETSDPLQVTTAQDEESDSDISENMAIQDNYDSILENLNKQNRPKTRDTSLNINKNKKEKTKEPIIDQLNLTQTKKSKKNEKTNINVPKNKDEESCDSIDMRLLFSEDSNDSEMKPEKVIPLKRMEGKTNIRESLEKDQESLFFIDTKGDLPDDEMIMRESAKFKNKKQKHSISEAGDGEINMSVSRETSDVTTPNKKNINKSALDTSLRNETAHEENQMNITSNSSKKKKKNKSISEDTIQNISMESKKTNNSLLNSQINEVIAVETSSAKKKKKNKSLSEETPLTKNITLESENKNVSLQESQVTEETVTVEPTLENSDKKKKKNKSLQDVSELVAGSEDTQEITLSDKKKKKKKKNKSPEVSQMLENIETEEVTSSNNEKKKKKKHKQLENNEETDVIETPLNQSSESQKKKKNKPALDIAEIEFAGEDSDEAPMEVSFKSAKDYVELVQNEESASKSKNKFKKKKKKKAHIPPENLDKTEESETKGKKRKLDVNATPVDKIIDESPKTKKPKKKKFEDEGNEYNEGDQKAKKRKADEDNIQATSKVFKGNFFKKIHVPRLPDNVVNQLQNESKSMKKPKTLQAISTMPFVVEEGPKRKNKPSNYLEQSVYLNDSISPQKKPKPVKKFPKVLPFMPTAITSDEGFTSKFRINVLPESTEFMAQANTTTNFRDQYLAKQRVKKLKLERFKKQNTYKNKF